ncbi:MAG: TPM domain-containing protein, partial [Gammaproteobacteria bacterium]|nr:TPM domain-containing protein [Gammaproteobacteria bacterium]
SDTIRRVEAKTHGEIVTVIARASGNYYYYPTLWAAVLAILSPVILLALPWHPEMPGIIELQLFVFTLLAITLRWRPIKRLLVPRDQQRLYCGRRAREQFLAQGLHRTKDRAGVLLYVSLDERHVELLADAGIHARVAAGTWDKVVRDFTARVKTDRVCEGFVEAINAVGSELARHFPADGVNPNELPDHLVEL